MRVSIQGLARVLEKGEFRDYDTVALRFPKGTIINTTPNPIQMPAHTNRWSGYGKDKVWTWQGVTNNNADARTEVIFPQDVKPQVVFSGDRNLMRSWWYSLYSS